jgi:hypothetical protein
MVQDLCFFLEKLGVKIDGVGTTTLTVHGVREIDVDVDYAPSEDPIEAMSLLAAAIVTESEITICRVPIEFLEIELPAERWASRPPQHEQPWPTGTPVCGTTTKVSHALLMIRFT